MLEGVVTFGSEILYRELIVIDLVSGAHDCLMGAGAVGGTKRVVVTEIARR